MVAPLQVLRADGDWRKMHVDVDVFRRYLQQVVRCAVEAVRHGGEEG